MKFYRRNNKLIIEDDYWTKRINPYTDKDVGRHKTFVGIITQDKDGNEEMGLARVIDRAYKGKDDDFTIIQIHYWGDKKDFEKMCKEIGLDIIYYNSNQL